MRAHGRARLLDWTDPLFIELTDHLRCPAGHDEAFLVLIPDVMNGRLVRSGLLGCPACGAEYRIVEGVAELGARGPAHAPEASALPGAEAVHAFLGLEGPGGYVAVSGDSARLAGELAGLLPGVHLVAVNPPAVTLPTRGMSVVRAPRFPLKRRSLRGMVVGTDVEVDPAWWAEAVGAVLPGLRVVGPEPPPAVGELELLARAAGWWVGRRV